MQSVHKAVLLQEVVDGFTSESFGGKFLNDLRPSPPLQGGDRGVVNPLKPPPSPLLEKEGWKHEPLNNKSSSIPYYLDGTLGGCGHALAVANALGGDVNIIGLDRDPQAIERARGLLDGKAKQVILECENFRNLDQVLDQNSIATVDLILLDLGISSDELENSGKGFSFMKDEPLVMTFGDPSYYPFTAYTIVNSWKEEDIANVIYGYGEERFARRIARKIIDYREKKKIETTFELVEIIKSAVPVFYRRGKINPATKTFQALRIAVNDELNTLREGLSKGYERLAIGGRMAVISFHSLEDRIVKNFYKEQVEKGANIITKKPIKPSLEEINTNSRARSAKLRIIQRN